MAAALRDSPLNTSLLAKEGKRVVVLDDGPLAHGTPYVTTAHLSDAIDDRFTNIEFWHGVGEVVWKTSLLGRSLSFSSHKNLK